MLKELAYAPPCPRKLPSRTKGAKESLQLFKNIFLRVQELLIPTCKESSKAGRRTAWVSKDLLVKLKWAVRYSPQ